MLNDTERQVLVALFRMARNNRHATAIRLANAVGLAPDEVRAALAALEAKGLADAERVRLSLNGLVVATSLSASAEVRPARAARSVVPATSSLPARASRSGSARAVRRAA